jgi:predicted transcriptional regulator
MEKLMSVFNVLSKPDAMTIFLLAREGLPAETEAPYKIGLTRKQYYTRLKQLVDLGLIERIEGVYYHTTLGSLVYDKHIVELANSLAYKKEMKMIDVLKKSNEFTTDEITKFLTKVAGDRADIKCELIWSWEAMVNTLIDRISKAEREVLLASRFYEEKIINAIMHRSKLGVDARVIVDIPLFQSYFKKHAANIKKDKHYEERINTAANPWYDTNNKVERRFTHLPFSIIIIDSKECAIELVDASNPEEFYACILIKDEKVAKSIRRKYNDIWSLSIDDIKPLIEK